MPASVLWKLSIGTLPEFEEPISEILSDMFGESPSSYTDLETGRTTVSIFFERRPVFSASEHRALDHALARVEKDGLRSEAREVSLKRMRNQDWAESWKLHFKPISVGTSLLIKPGWSRRRPSKGQSVVILDPGLSFGTGQHPTTLFCLRQLVSSRKRREVQSFLDIGTGSGILAIAAAKLGYAPVDGFDYDPLAIRIARENAGRNRVAHKIRFGERDATELLLRPRRKYDVVCANLISNLLIEQRDRILGQVKPVGTLALAGVLASEFHQVRKAYVAGGMKLVRHRRQKEWCSGSFVFCAS